MATHSPEPDPQNTQAPPLVTRHDCDNGVGIHPAWRLYAKIGQLEGALQHKDKVLALSQNEQAVLRKQLAACIKMLQDGANLLSCAGNELKNNSSQILSRIDALEQENKVLLSSSEAWSNRAIILQMALLSGQREEKIITEGHAWAVSKIALLERELKAAKAEICALRGQVNQYKS